MTETNEPVTNACPVSFPGERALHIFALCAFAFTQPVLVALVRQTVYLQDQQVDWLEISVLLSILLLVIPLSAVMLDRIVVQIASSVDGRGRNTVLAVLMGLIILSVLRPYMAIPLLEITGCIGLMAVLMTIPSSWYLVHLYDRLPGFRSWVTLSSIGLLIFPGTFLWRYHVIRQVETNIGHSIAVGNPVPVIVIVFDEFNGTTLMNERAEIDPERFPQFTRLAQRSTWYRNATTVHPRTQVAVPAILSGRYPKTEKSPLAAQYPGNLLQLIESTKKYDMAVFEPATRLCPLAVRDVPPPQRSALQRCVDLVHTMAAVYPRLIVSRDVPLSFPAIPRTWFGLTVATIWNEADALKPTEGRFNYSSLVDREKQFDHFLLCLHASDRARFGFYHTVLPHFSWCFLPTGEQYQIEANSPHFPAGAVGELGEDWRADPAIVLRNEHRYRLQAGFVDLLIGRLLDRLELTGLIDRCLLIVTADHGVSFQPGHSRRLPDATNLSDIMSVPLFIKLPGQTEGRTDDRNIESIDLLPTIAEVLKMELPEPVDGISISVEKRRLRKTLYFESAMTVVEPDLPQRRAALKRQTAIFGTGPLDRAPVGAASHPEWHGRSVSSFLVEKQTLPVLVGNPLQYTGWQPIQIEGVLKRCFVTGWLNSNEVRGSVAEIVVALDGVIVDTGKTFPYTRAYQGFEFLLPKPYEIQRDDQLELYLVEQTEPRVRLRPLKKEDAPDRFNQKN